MQKMAVIINGDTGGRHLENVDRALVNVLKPQGYETWVASPSRPSASHDRYFRGDREGIQNLLKQLKAKSGPNTELVIYTTGHGEEEGFCLGSNCNTQDLLARLDRLPFEKKRVVVMDQCYGGNFGKLFLDDPKTLFTSAGSKGETDRCEEIAPRLWAPNREVPDQNGDGTISWQERFAHAAMGRELSSTPQFVMSPGYVGEGESPFSGQVQEIEDEAALRDALGRLRPGQYAVILFSASWCYPCKRYAPEFDRFAKEGGGRDLWLITENNALAEKWGVSGYPTVVVVNWRGDRRIIEDRNVVPEEIAPFEATLEERFQRRIAAAEKIEDDRKRADTFLDIASSLASVDLREKAMAVFKQSIAAAEKIGDDEDRSSTFLYIAFCWPRDSSREREEAMVLYNKSIAAAEKIEDDQKRARRFQTIGSFLVGTDSKKAVVLYDESIAAAERTGDDRNRAKTFLVIAFSLAKDDLGEETKMLFLKLIVAAEKIESSREKAYAIRGIASSLTEANLGNFEKEVFFNMLITAAKRIRDDEDWAYTQREIKSSIRQAGLSGRVRIPTH
ncbi:MAG: hypothetical protein HY466_06120 [Deltaproteobacteria bacterium]|nr:hypothetical protein [Deltaproteobacteria bacterium]